MARIRFLLSFCLFLLFAGTGDFTAAQKIHKKNSKPDIKLVVPTWTDYKDTLPMDLMHVAYTAPAIPMEDALREEQKNPKKVVIVPAPPPPPGPEYIPPKYPDAKKN